MLLLWYATGFLLLKNALCFWDMGTTTVGDHFIDERPRQSVFRWLMTQSQALKVFFPSWDWVNIGYRRRLAIVCGFSIYFTNLGTGTILNRRTLLSSANIFEPWLNVERDIRIWAPGRGGTYKTPYRYRVWRVRRIIPRSNNPEHWHGPRGRHVPRHDIAVIHSMDQIYHTTFGRRYLYALRAMLYTKHKVLPDSMFFAGSGYETLEHIRENYKIFFHIIPRVFVVDCSKYLPKWWGKFICFRSNEENKYWMRVAGIPSGGGLYDWDMEVMAVGCFEIRYNEDRIWVFTDLRYYVDHIHTYANISRGEYYEYAYQMWGSSLGLITDSGVAVPFIPGRYIADDYYPLGR